jgi:hypothetical protein
MHEMLGSSMRRQRIHLHIPQFGLVRNVLNWPKLKLCQHLS